MTDARHPEEITIERWEYDNPSWLVIINHPVITTSPDGKVNEEREVKVENRETGEVASGIGADVAMALAMINHRLSERM